MLCNSFDVRLDQRQKNIMLKNCHSKDNLGIVYRLSTCLPLKLTFVPKTYGDTCLTFSQSHSYKRDSIDMIMIPIMHPTLNILRIRQSD